MTLSGGCYCGSLEYEIDSPLGPVVNCHCAFCRRIHGAAFTTVALIPAEAIAWKATSERPTTFETPLGNVRHFCGRCASPIWNLAPTLQAGVVVTGSLAQSFQPVPWLHVNIESQAPWYTIQDGLPQFREWPDTRTLRSACAEHPGAWVPEPLLERIP